MFKEIKTEKIYKILLTKPIHYTMDILLDFNTQMMSIQTSIKTDISKILTQQS